ncbi:MAG: flavin reductase [Saprospiraceae bacterium]
MTTTFSLEAIQAMDRRFRANLVNSLAGYKQPVLVGTRSADGQTNLAIFNSLLHIGADPALYGLLVRPHTVRRDTLENILETGTYTLNYPSVHMMQPAHQTSAKYPQEESEFDATGLTVEYRDDWPAPFVKEAPVQIAMSLSERLDIQSNNTILLIGRMNALHLDPGLIQPDGFAELHQANVLACVGLDAYYQPRFLERLAYARPDSDPSA